MLKKREIQKDTQNRKKIYANLQTNYCIFKEKYTKIKKRYTQICNAETTIDPKTTRKQFEKNQKRNENELDQMQTILFLKYHFNTNTQQLPTKQTQKIYQKHKFNTKSTNIITFNKITNLQYRIVK